MTTNPNPRANALLAAAGRSQRPIHGLPSAFDRASTAVWTTARMYGCTGRRPDSGRGRLHDEPTRRSRGHGKYVRGVAMAARLSNARCSAYGVAELLVRGAVEQPTSPHRARAARATEPGCRAAGTDRRRRPLLCLPASCDVGTKHAAAAGVADTRDRHPPHPPPHLERQWSGTAHQRATHARCHDDVGYTARERVLHIDSRTKSKAANAIDLDALAAADCTQVPSVAAQACWALLHRLRLWPGRSRDGDLGE